MSDRLPACGEGAAGFAGLLLGWAVPVLEPAWLLRGESGARPVSGLARGSLGVLGYLGLSPPQVLAAWTCGEPVLAAALHVLCCLGQMNLGLFTYLLKGSGEFELP